ncbi:MAG: hypothetical protein U0J41_04180 [Slackia isoflavoniconvertens]|nr:hypothetical protein [Slackia isoflavoniconvertens]
MRYEADSVWLRALRCVRCDAHDFLQRHRCAIAIGVCAPLWWALVEKAFLQKLTSAHPQEKEKARSDERA